MYSAWSANIPLRPPGSTQLVWLAMMSALAVPAACSAWRLGQYSAPGSPTMVSLTLEACPACSMVACRGGVRASAGPK